MSVVFLRHEKPKGCAFDLFHTTVDTPTFGVHRIRQTRNHFIQFLLMTEMYNVVYLLPSIAIWQFLILCEMYFISLSGDPESPYQLSKKKVGGHVFMC